MASSTEVLNGDASKSLDRAAELDDLLKAVQSLIIPFVRAADDSTLKSTLSTTDDENKNTSSRPVPPTPEELQSLMSVDLPLKGLGKAGLLSTVQNVLKYSVNTWDRGFLDKLFASTNAVGVISELVLAVLNTNVHVFKVSPALTIIEKTTARAFANLFGFGGAHAGGISTQGGSASNFTSIIIARNTLFPDSKKIGNDAKRFVIFTSAVGHFSVQKAAQMCGFGTENVWPIPVDDHGRMIPSELERLINKSKAESRTPFYVNATAGTTVLGSYDPFIEISSICKKHNLWLHVDASWGGSVIFSQKYKYKLTGANLADSLAVNPHKMLGVPITCSFLLTPDLRIFHKANTTMASYLFHSNDHNEDVWDLADLTLQCSRRADSFKLALAWVYYGSNGFEKQIDHAFSMAAQLATRVAENPAFSLVSENPPPCLQVCFYYIGKSNETGLNADRKPKTNLTTQIVDALIPKGYLVDYAAGGENGPFIRAVVNRDTQMETISNFIKAIEEVGSNLEEEMTERI